MRGLDSFREGIQFVKVDGLSIRSSRGGQAQGIPIVLTSPWPESIYTFRDVWTDLGSRGPLLAFELPGFGQSEGRTEVFSVLAMEESASDGGRTALV
jgi:pimeloyl-ACP methyl ester carboxylesterase